METKHFATNEQPKKAAIDTRDCQGATRNRQPKRNKPPGRRKPERTPADRQWRVERVKGEKSSKFRDLPRGIRRGIRETYPIRASVAGGSSDTHNTKAEVSAVDRTFFLPVPVRLDARLDRYRQPDLSRDLAANRRSTRENACPSDLV